MAADEIDRIYRAGIRTVQLNSFVATGANVHDIHGFKPLLQAIPPVRSRREPRRRRSDKVRADKAYEAAELRRWLRQRGIDSRITRKGIEPKERLGRHRWKIERTISWLLNHRRPAVRYERHGDLFTAFLNSRSCRGQRFSSRMKEAHCPQTESGKAEPHTIGRGRLTRLRLQDLPDSALLRDRVADEDGQVDQVRSIATDRQWRTERRRAGRADAQRLHC
ncbi:transposase [Actinocorallia libanotica]|uniref:transposase n=1 Tax=Actinocorallia libanotica TaxID=46162 RepID=UPI003CD06249